MSRTIATMSAISDAVKPPQVSDEEAPTPAIDQVFSMPELIENIVGHLPANQILVNQRVCHTWKYAIASKDLQEKLYLRPSSTELVEFRSSFDLGDTDIVTVNLSLVSTPFDNSLGKWQQVSSKKPLIPKPNPLLHRYLVPLKAANNTTEYSFIHRGLIAEPLHYPHHISIAMLGVGIGATTTKHFGPRTIPEWKAMCRKDASWRKMFVMQPPCETLDFKCERLRKVFRLENPKGITMGFVVWFLKVHTSECEDCMKSSPLPQWRFRGNDFGAMGKEIGLLRER
ncbi:hypothetical protein CB0940_06552 [Cercospora beticola]|uniref:F-box domain-containing protein n=2 Tax=Cercospora beticola TaxID=122368 RepID=A0A2G5HXS1_CERBT|nr:hypothetical protein CB0940_06552 [Cercospora beticola]PIA97345.1 hypothetical protein CB0940_06552 [Cercospora beticola]